MGGLSSKWEAIWTLLINYVKSSTSVIFKDVKKIVKCFKITSSYFWLTKVDSSVGLLQQNFIWQKQIVIT